MQPLFPHASFWSFSIGLKNKNKKQKCQMICVLIIMLCNHNMNNEMQMHSLHASILTIKSLKCITEYHNNNINCFKFCLKTVIIWRWSEQICREDVDIRINMVIKSAKLQNGGWVVKESYHQFCLKLWHRLYNIFSFKLTFN